MRTSTKIGQGRRDKETGEPDEAISLTSGSEGDREKRPAMDLARGLPSNEVYDTEHIPNLLKVPGVHAVTRTKGEPFAVSIGGEEQQVAHEGPRYSALYEIDGPHVLVSAAWAKAVELGRWPSQVRPYTRNRRHTLYQVC